MVAMPSPAWAEKSISGEGTIPKTTVAAEARKIAPSSSQQRPPLGVPAGVLPAITPVRSGSGSA